MVQKLRRKCAVIKGSQSVAGLERNGYQQQQEQSESAEGEYHNSLATDYAMTQSRKEIIVAEKVPTTPEDLSGSY